MRYLAKFRADLAYLRMVDGGSPIARTLLEASLIMLLGLDVLAIAGLPVLLGWIVLR